ncbi:replication termination factor 2 [Arctopsyche grandis]|uniref:replication termination factor 2 n=1 Tax=Arctopsyche grandis TaxID=121162 RepID=UPI00406D80C2
MGCDGGTIPKRDELVKLKKKPEQKDKDAELAFKWRHCALSQQVLQQPIVACSLGRLYTKSTLIEYLLDKSNTLENMKHIKSLKDVRDLKLTKNPAYKDKAEKTEGAIDERGAPYICPVIGLEMSGKFKFIFIWSCGCVMSERAFKEVKMKLCHLCMEPFETCDVVVINGAEDEIPLMQTNMEIRQTKLKEKKKNKSKAEPKPVEVPVNEEASSSTSNFAVPKINDTKTVKPTTGKDSESSKIVKSGKRPANSKDMQDPVYKKTKDDYSVAKDPKATDVFKSLFTTHRSEKDQKRAHWITYNPFYN